MGDTQVRSGRAQAEEIRRKEAHRQRRQTLTIYGGVIAVALMLIALAAIGIRNASKDNAATANGDLKSIGGLGAASAPPWPLPSDAPARVKAAGLDLGAMGTAEHYHAHLDVIIDGKPVVVPQGIGIDPRNGAMSALHTHSSDGIIHIEAPVKGRPLTVGQLFTQWNVRLSRTQIGNARAADGKTLKAYVNGKEVAGNPAMIPMAEKQQIALVYGPADSTAKPPTFKFPDQL